MKRYFIAAVMTLLGNVAFAQVHSGRPSLNVKEIDGTPSAYPVILRFPNGSLTTDANGTTVTVAIAGGGGGSSGVMVFQGGTFIGNTSSLTFSLPLVVTTENGMSTVTLDVVNLPAGATNYIWHSTAPTPGVFHVTSGTIDNTLVVGSTLVARDLHYTKNLVRDGNFMYPGGSLGAGGTDAMNHVNLGANSITGQAVPFVSFIGPAVTGGGDNWAAASYSTVGGGRNNQAWGQYNYSGGGDGNWSSGIHVFLGSGFGNAAKANQSFLGGGFTNLIDTAAVYGVIAGGISNIISSRAATILGGENNQVHGNNSMAAGKRMVLHGQRSFLWGNSASNVISYSSDAFMVYTGSFTVGSTSPTSKMDIVDGSVTIRGNFAGLNLVDGDYRGNGRQLYNTVSFYDEGAFQQMGSSVNCVGAGVTCTGSGQTLTFTVVGGGGGGSSLAVERNGVYELNVATVNVTRDLQYIKHDSSATFFVDLSTANARIDVAQSMAQNVVSTNSPSILAQVYNIKSTNAVILQSQISNILSSNVVNGTLVGTDVNMSSFTLQGPMVSSAVAQSFNATNLKATNAPAAGQVPKFDSGGGVTWSADANDGGSGTDDTSLIKKAFTVTIATSSELLADFIGTDQTPFNAAIASVTPNGGSIYVRRGLYTFTAAVDTIPWNASIEFEEGVTLTNSGNFNVFRCSGTWKGGQVTTAAGFNSTFLLLQSSSAVSDLTFTKCGAGTGGNMISAYQETNLTLDGINFVDNTVAVTWYGVNFNNVTSVRIRNFYNFNNSNTNVVWRIDNSTGILITGGWHTTLTGNIGVYLESVFDTNVTNSVFESRATTADGIFYFNGVSSGVAFTNNYLIGTSAATSEGVTIRDMALAVNIYIANNVCKGFGEACFNVQANARNVYLSGNVVASGLFVSDTGVGTTYRDNRLTDNTFQSDSSVLMSTLTVTSSATIKELYADNIRRVGTINLSSNPVDWSELKNVPAAFADGTDDGGGGVSVSSYTGFLQNGVFKTNMSTLNVSGSDLQVIGNDFSSVTLRVDLSTINARADVLNSMHNVIVATNSPGILAQIYNIKSTNSIILQSQISNIVGTNVVVNTVLNIGSMTTAGSITSTAAIIASTGIYNFICTSSLTVTSSATIKELYASNIRRVGTINLSSNPVSWTQLQGVPAAFADGTDDGSGGGGDGDGLGMHRATQTVDMSSQSIVFVATVSFTNGNYLPKIPIRSFTIPAASMKGSSNNPAGDSAGFSQSTETVLGFNVDFMAFADSSTANKEAYFDFDVPNGWDGSSVTFMAVWSSTAGLLASSVTWCLQGVSFVDGSSMTTQAYGSPACVSDALDRLNSVRITSETAVFLGGSWSGPNASSTFFTIYRGSQSSPDDTLGSTARLHKIKIRVQGNYTDQ